MTRNTRITPKMQKKKKTFITSTLSGSPMENEGSHDAIVPRHKWQQKSPKLYD